MGALPRINNFKRLKILVREGKNCFHDPYRNALVIATLEEAVRQKTALYFEEVLGAPHESIMTEVPLVHYTGRNHGRADIVISRDTAKGYVPMAVIECKEPSFPLTTTALEQVTAYANHLGAGYIFLTNGQDLLSYRLDSANSTSELLKTPPNYKDMLSNKGTPFARVTFPSIRPTLEEYSNKGILEDQWERFGGEDTAEELRIPICNYYDALIMDTEHKLPLINRGYFSVIEDRGVILLNNGNRSGEGYFGNYRSFLVKLNRGDAKMVSISIFGIDPGFEDRGRGYTSLVVSTNVKTSSHNILQLNMDDFVELSSNAMTIRHNGKISSLKSKDLMSYIRKQNTDLIVDDNDEVLLGSLPLDQLYHLDDPAVSEFTYNLIEYGLLREKFRESKTKRKRGK